MKPRKLLSELPQVLYLIAFHKNHSLTNGWIYDNQGYCVFYTQNATGGPTKPVKQVSPVKMTTRVKPVKGVKSVKPVKPIKRLSWVSNSDNFFN